MAAVAAQSARRSATIVSKTGWTSVGELRDDPEDLARRRLLLERLGEVAVPRFSSSVKRRTFSMAMTAWSAKVLRSSICAVGERSGLGADDHDGADRTAFAQQRDG